MRGSRVFGAILLALLVTPPALYSQVEQLRLEASEEIPPGGVIRVTVEAPAEVDRLTAALFDGETELSANYGVPLDNRDGRTSWSVLLGVASTIRPGRYTLRVHGSPGPLIEERQVSVAALEFRREDIRLNTTISELRSSDDPRKREQALQMIALTNSFNGDALFWNGAFDPPLETDRRTSRYGDRRRFIYADGGEARSIHNGVDLAAPQGTPVYAPGAGRVVFAEERIVTGNSVVLEHYPGVYGLFYHLDRITVETGQTVAGGDRLGTVGSTGVSTGPHLHWEIRVGGVSVDPAFFLDEPLVDRNGGIGAVSQ